MTGLTTDQWPPFPLGHPTNHAWREFALTRAAEMRGLLEWFKAMPPDKVAIDPGEAASLDRIIELHLDDAIDAAKGIAGSNDSQGPEEHSVERTASRDRTSRRIRPRKTSTIARVTGHLDAAETALLRRAPEAYFKGQVDHMLAHVRFHLPKGDQRREGAETIATRIQKGDPLDESMREAIVRAVSIASYESRRENNSVQSFSNIILCTAVILFLGAVGITLWGAFRPTDLSLCFDPNNPDTPGPVCPVGNTESSWDVFSVAAIGVLAAAISGSSSLRHMSGKSGRFGLPVALAVLKLPLGALSAVLGLLLVRGSFIPGLSDLDSSAQILAWAIVLGASQQLLTGFVDRHASNVVGQLDSQTNKQLA